jgi:hypothetical protein
MKLLGPTEHGIYMPWTTHAFLQAVQAPGQLVLVRTQHAQTNAELARLQQPQKAAEDRKRHNLVANPLEGVLDEFLEASDSAVAEVRLAGRQIRNARLATFSQAILSRSHRHAIAQRTTHLYKIVSTEDCMVEWL